MEPFIKENSVIGLNQFLNQHKAFLLEHSKMAIAMFLLDGKLFFVNQRFASVYSSTAEDMLDKKIHEFCHFTLQHFPEFLDTIDAGRTVRTHEMYANGSYYLYKIQGFFKNSKAHFMITLVEITSYKRQNFAARKVNHQLEYFRMLDRLTGLNNFSAFEQKIWDIQQQSKSDDIGMILINIDKFNKINEEKGYLAADAIIKQVSACLEKLSDHQQYCLYRLRDDEFIFTLQPIQNWALYTFAEKILAQIYQLNIFTSFGVDSRLTVSLAIKTYKTGMAFDTDFFLVQLQQLMTQAKLKGGNTWVDTIL